MLKVFDCYRPARAVAHFVRWARDLDDNSTKAEFYPEVDKRNLFATAISPRAPGHSRGSTVDLTLARAARRARTRHGHAVRFLQSAVVAVGQSVSADARANRALLAAGHAHARLHGLRQGMVALHAAQRAVPEHLFRFSGALNGWWRAEPRMPRAQESPPARNTDRRASGRSIDRHPSIASNLICLRMTNAGWNAAVPKDCKKNRAEKIGQKRG